MTKKGFTLIELLAVILILSIILLIAIPAVNGLIEDSKKGAAEASAKNIVNAAETYYTEQAIKGVIVDNIDLTDSTLNYTGTHPTKGYVIFDSNGFTESKMYISSYCVTKDINDNMVVKKMDEEDCEIDLIPEDPKPDPLPVYKKYNDGEVLLFNPKDNVKCENSIGSRPGTNDGCMKWYTFLDSENSPTVKLMLDHNITDEIVWNSDRSKNTPDTVNAQLAIDVSNWDIKVKSTARLISVEEINEIAPPAAEHKWDKFKWSSGYYFHTGSENEYFGVTGSNSHGWLFDNTHNCTSYGCNSSSWGTYGYWTSSYANNGYAWHTYFYGNLDSRGVATLMVNADPIGIRPVIEVSKSIFE